MSSRRACGRWWRPSVPCAVTQYRGEFDLELLGTPLELMGWEPGYQPAVYRSDRADFPAPDPVPLEPIDPVDDVVAADDPDSEDALFGLVRIWVEESNGMAHVVTVEGTAGAAMAAAASGPATGARVSFAEAMAWMGWAGANGGAYGSRRGGPVGRSAAWAAVAALADVDWPPDPADVEAAGAGLEWWLWEPHRQLGGWHLGLAVEDPAEGLAWAISGRDELDEEAAPKRGQLGFRLFRPRWKAVRWNQFPNNQTIGLTSIWLLPVAGWERGSSTR